jgi:hypothetical protein
MLETLIFVGLLTLTALINLFFYFIAGTCIKVWWRGNSDLEGLTMGVFILLASVTLSLLVVKLATLLPF